MRVVIFGTHHAGSRVVESLRQEHEIVGLVTPHARGWRELMISSFDKLWRKVRRFEVKRSDLAGIEEPLRALKPDAICISGFPWVLPEALLSIPKVGAINAHPSLLPRHRGPLPLFWIYREDDRETGVTIHRATARVDAGAILRQVRFDLSRGFPVRELAEKKQRLAADLLRETLQMIGSGRDAARLQQEELATEAPRVQPGTRAVDFETWPAERIWHFLHGLYPFFIEPLGVPYRGVAGFEVNEHKERPGSIASTASEWLLYSRDGMVRLLR